MRVVRLLILFTGLVALTPSRAEAYLDPGSGSMLLQLILGGAAGLAVLVKLYWRKLLTLLRVRPVEKGRS